MKKYLFLIIIFSFIVIACDKIDVSKLSDKDLERLSDKLIVCNKPYIRYASECCLDQNDNKICDRDERKLTEEEKKKEKEANKETPPGLEPPIEEPPAEPTKPEKTEKETPKPKELSGKCTFPYGIKCIDYKINGATNSIILTLENSFENELYYGKVYATGYRLYGQFLNWQNNEAKTFVLSYSDGSLLNLPIYKGDINVTFREVNGGDYQKVQGALVAEIENQNTGEKCTLPSGIGCVDFEVTPQNILVMLKNVMGADLNSIVVKAENCGNSGAGVSLLNGEAKTFTINCGSALSGSMYNGQLTVLYNAESGLKHSVSGQLIARIK